MELCDNGHVEIVYNSTLCPLCLEHEMVHDLRKELKTLENELADAKNEILESVERDAGSAL